MKINTQVLIFIVCLMPSIGYSSPQKIDTKKDYDIEKSESRELKVSRNAETWGLTVKEWERYLDLMEGDAKFQFKNASPLRVLGMYSNDKAEREKYAIMQVKDEYNRLDRYLKFDKLYKLKRIELLWGKPIFDKEFEAEQKALVTSLEMRDKLREKSNSPLQMGDVIVLFLDPDSRESAERYVWAESLRSQTVGAKLDIYFVYSTEEEIAEWARNNRINPNFVNRNIVTLNRDEGYAEKLGIDIFDSSLYVIRNNSLVKIDI